MPASPDTTTAPPPTRLQNAADGRGLLLPLVAKNGDAPIVLELPEPSMEQLADIYDWVLEADEVLDKEGGELPEIGPALQFRLDAQARDPQNAPPLTEDDYVVLHNRQKVAKERRKVQFGHESPHGLATAKIAGLLTGREVTLADLPGWVMDPRICAQILARYTAPFAGPGEELTAAVAAALAGSEPS